LPSAQHLRDADHEHADPEKKNGLDGLPGEELGGGHGVVWMKQRQFHLAGREVQDDSERHGDQGGDKYQARCQPRE